MVALSKPCLVLNNNYEPLSVVKVKRGIVLIYLGKVEVVEEYEFLSPSILKLKYYVPVRRVYPPLSKVNVFRRDNYTCQYCGAKGTHLTIDHIIPKDRGGKTVWENVVTACIKCNNKKGNRTPKEVGMKLLSKPRRPYFLINIHQLPESWKPFIFLDNTNKLM